MSPCRFNRLFEAFLKSTIALVQVPERSRLSSLEPTAVVGHFLMPVFTIHACKEAGTMSHKTLEANSIPIPPHLAGLLKQTLGRSGNGFDEGAFLQQLHYWTLNAGTTGWIVDGVKWIYNSLKTWQQQFPWMSEYGLRKAIANLKKLELIQTAQHWITSYQRVMFYRIDYEKLKAFASDLCDLITPRPGNSDPIEVLDDRTTDTDTSAHTSFSELQTVVVSQIDQSLEDQHSGQF